MECFEAFNHALWLRSVVNGLQIAVSYANNNMPYLREKYIEIKSRVVKERVHNGKVSMKHIGTSSMVRVHLLRD